MFFATVGALVLNEHYKIASLQAPFSCSLTRRLPKNEDGVITSDLDGFHMWIQTQTHVIDFMMPILNESIEGKGYHPVSHLKE